MANSIKIDANHKGVIAGITDDVAQDIINIRVDPITNRVKTTIEPLDSSVDSVTAVNSDGITNYDTKVIAYTLDKINTITYSLAGDTVATKTFTWTGDYITNISIT